VTDRTLQAIAATMWSLSIAMLFVLPFVMAYATYVEYRDTKRYETNCVARFNSGATVTPRCLDHVMTKAENTFGAVK